MGLFAKFFSATWWNGATFGTSLFSRRYGREVGRDEFGNVYLQHKKDPTRRWVIYPGANDGSRVAPQWQAWLKNTIDDLPEKSLPPRRPFEKPAEANHTGTFAAYKPGGSLAGHGVRPAATGDYQAWKPE